MTRAAVAVLCALTACSQNAAPVPRAPASPPPLTSVLATAACPALRERLFALASDERVIDTYAWVKECSARIEGNDVAVVADAYTWMAVDRELGAVAVREFVHATVHGEIRLVARATYANGRLVVTLTPKAAPSVSVEPVGALDLAALNWASLLAIELAPAAGASPEALAKGKLREEVERTLASSLAKPLEVTYDARRGTASLGGAAEEGRAKRLRVGPHGTALVGPFPPSDAGSSARLHVVAEAPVRVRPVCRTHAARLVDADRRGDPISTDDWILAEGKTAVDLTPMPCTWMLALRSSDAIAIVDIESVHSEPARSLLESPDRWVSVDDATFEGAGPELDTTVVLTTESWSAALFPRGKNALPAVIVLGPDEHLIVRAHRRERGALVTIAEGRVPVDAPGNVAVSVPLTASDDRPFATVRVRARVRRAEQ
jgi:hypothetical protein